MPPFPSHEQEVPPGVLSDREQEALQQYNPDLPPYGSIGDDSASHGQALAYLMRVGREAQEAREGPVTQAVRNAKIYQWGQECEPQPDDVIANDIQTAVLSISNIQTQEPFAIFIRPVQTRDKAQVFWIGPPVDANLAAMTQLPIGLGMVPVLDPLGQPMMQPVADPMTGMPAADPMTGAPAMQPMMQAADPNAPPVPLDEISAWQVRKLAAAGTFPSEWLFVLDDRAVADVYQTVFDVHWKDAKGDDFVRENLLHTNIYGYQTGYYSWDAALKQHVLRHVSIKEAFLDPKWMTLDQMNYAGFEVVMDIDQAKAEYPQLASVIDDYAKIGLPSRVDSATEFGSGDDRQFWRRTVTFRVMFFRNQQVPMTPQEALRAGLIVEGPDGYHLAQAQGATDGTDGSGAPAVPGVSGGPDVRAEDGTGATGIAEPGEQAAPAAPGMEPGKAEALQGAAAGSPEAIQPPAPPPPQWPMTLGIRQIATLAQTGRIVQDIRLEHYDIPMLLNQCIPQPSQPFAQGLPEKLSGMQKADIRLLNSVVKYAETFSTPGCMIPQSVAEALKGGLKRTHVNPTETLVVPDDIMRDWGDKAVIWNVPPALPPAIPEVMEMLDRRTKETSGHSEVLQGTAPSPNSSGRMVEALQAGAAGQFGFQAQWTAKMVERLANLMHYTHLWRLDLADMMEMYSRLPPALLQMVIDRARRNRWDIQVDANNGASGMRNRKLREALSMFAAVSPKTGEPVMPLKMVREEANIDHEEASIAFKQEMENGMPMMPPAPGGAPSPGQPGQGGPPAPPSDGQGTASPIE